MLLINPPVTKPCEPPAGIARLAAALSRRGCAVRVLDANLEGLLYLLQTNGPEGDTWTRRAANYLARHLSGLRDGRAFAGIDTYTRAISDISRLLTKRSEPFGARVTLSDYGSETLRPIRSTDLERAAATPQQNPFFDYFRSRLSPLLEEREPAWVGISINFLSQALTAFALIGYLKQLLPNVRIALGGGLITSWLRRPDLAVSFAGLADVLIDGPGEERLLALAGCSAPWQDASLPAYGQLALDAYLAPGRIIPYNTAQGCYWNSCTFCPERAEATAYRPVPPAQAVRDLQELSACYQPSLLHLLDSALSPATLRALADVPPGTPWYGFARITRELRDEHFCRALRQAGCVMLKLGIESGSDAVLAGMHKGISVAEAGAALRALHAAGIATYVYLLFGTPQESPADAYKTMNFAVANSEYIGFLNLAVFNMPAYGPQVAVVETRRFFDADLCLYTDFVHPLGWDRKAVRQFLDKTFKRHRAIAAIIKRDPPAFTSNHAPFFVRPAGPP